LTLAGYQHVTQVVAAGEYSVRGGLVDLFPMGTALPYRIELFDDEIETLRSFDVDSQRTLYPVPEIRLLPAREFPAGEAGRTTFRQRFREAFEGDASRVSLYKDVSNGILPAGIEYYLPLFFEKTATLFDYLPEHRPRCCCTATCPARSPSSGPTCKAATRCSAATARGRCCRRPSCSCATRNSSSPRRRCRNWS
jgi:transcription-repair coupling factor (superfamily II helicase)